MSFRFAGALVGLATAVAAGACSEDLPDCDRASAEQVVYEEGLGTPAYAGQALLHTGCGGGPFCHSQGAEGTFRYGAPSELDFDVGTACTVAEACDRETDALVRGHGLVLEWRSDIVGELRAETMPPGDVGVEVVAGLPRYVSADDVALPSVLEPEGRRIVENWLACGAPVVERTTPHPSGATRIGDVVPARDDSLPTPVFASIFARILQPRCGGPCHNPAAPELVSSGLDLSDPATAYAALVGTAAAGEACGGASATRVVPADAEASLLVQKLDGTATCGDPMPLGGTMLDPAVVSVVRIWIDNGALDN